MPGNETKVAEIEATNSNVDSDDITDLFTSAIHTH